MIQSKQELIDSLEAQAGGAIQERERYRDKSNDVDIQTFGELTGKANALLALARQLKREIGEEAVAERALPAQSDALPPLPEGTMETNRIIIRSYLTQEGDRQYIIHTRGESNKFDVIGSLEVAKFDLLSAMGNDS